MKMQTSAPGEEVNPTDGLKAESSREVFIARPRDDERPEDRVSPAEFEQAGEVPALESCALDLDGPRTPTAFEHAIDFERLLPRTG